MDEELAEFKCDDCGGSFKTQGALGSHKRTHETESPSLDSGGTVPAKGHAILSGQPRARRLMTAGRTVKLLRPVCPKPVEKGGCDTLYPGWFKTCKHNPYIGIVPREYDVPTYEDIPGSNRRKVTGTTKEVEWESRPNWKEVAVNERLGGVTRVDQARSRGCIYPWELVSPEYPEGIAEACQFRGCFQQTQANGQPLIVTEYGAYCREIEAKFAKIDQLGTVGDGKRIEVGFNQESQEKQRGQLQRMSV